MEAARSPRNVRYSGFIDLSKPLFYSVFFFSLSLRKIIQCTCKAHMELREHLGVKMGEVVPAHAVKA